MITICIFVVSAIVLIQIIDIIIDVHTNYMRVTIATDRHTTKKLLLVFLSIALLVSGIILNITTKDARTSKECTVNYKLKIVGDSVELTRVRGVDVKYDLKLYKIDNLGKVYVFDKNNFTIKKD